MISLNTTLALLMSSFAPTQNIKRKDKPEKKCLNCGDIHQHNNSFCSAKCNTEYKQKAK